MSIVWLSVGFIAGSLFGVFTMALMNLLRNLDDAEEESEHCKVVSVEENK